MEVLDFVKKLPTGKVEMILYIIVIFLALGVGVWGFFRGRKAKKRKEIKTENQDAQNSRQENREDEQDHAESGGSLRDRVRNRSEEGGG